MSISFRISIIFIYMFFVPSLSGLSLLIVAFIGRQSNAANVTISHQISGNRNTNRNLRGI